MSNLESDNPSASQNHCHPERSAKHAAEGPAVSAGLNVRQPPSEVGAHPLAQLRQFTPARIALGRSGASLPTKDLLEFSASHAMARDAVHASFHARAIAEQLAVSQIKSIQIHSAAADRATYLRRPDLGRKLDEPSRNRLAESSPAEKPELVFIIADGLSAISPERYAVPLIQQALHLVRDWSCGPVVIAEQARVALGDEIGDLLGAGITVMLIGERPGLSSPDSLGIYLTYDPKPGRTDAERNCISNIRNGGVSLEKAAATLSYLLNNARRLKLTGVALKDESDSRPPSPPGTQQITGC